MPSRKSTSLPYTELEVATGNFDTSRATIDRVIIHTMDGTWEGAAARFDNPTSQVSAHYGVKLDGTLIHWLEEFNTAYHAGDYAMNQRSIGIEHEDGADYNGVRPDVLYTESAKLVRDICQFYNIPIDRQHILKHNEVSDAPTGCPDALDIDRIVTEAAQGSSQQGTYVDAQTFATLVSKATNDDEFVKAGFNNASDVQTKISNLQSTIDNLNKEVGDLTNANTDLKNNIAEVQNQNASMLTQMQKMQNADSTAIDEGLKAEAALKEVTSDINTVASLLNTTYPTVKNILSAIDAMQSEIDMLKKTLPTTILPSQPSTPAQSFDLVKLIKEFFGIKTK